MIVVALVCAALSFTLSAAAGLGGSLILVPAMCLLLGAKHGVAVAALLLGCNNVAKVIVYRSLIPLKAAAGVLLLTVIGTAIGAQLLITAPESWVETAILASIGASLLWERRGMREPGRASAPVLALFAGATSGFSGTSGPLKGIALRNLGLDRMHFVGAASAVSLAGDMMKSALFARAALLNETAWMIALGAIPLMPLAALAGRHLNQRMGERMYAALFWAVMAGYLARMLLL